MTQTTHPSVTFSQPTDAAGRERPKVGQSWLVIGSSGLLVLAYHFAFQLTKPSALSAAPASQQVTAAAYGVVFVLLVTAAAVTFIHLVRWGLAAVGVTVKTVDLATLGTGLIATTGALALLENLSYSATGRSLKTTDLVALKVALLVLALSAGGLAALSWVRWVRRHANGATTAMLILGFGAATLVIADQASATSPPTATGARQTPNVVFLSSDGIDAAHMSVYGYTRLTTPFLDDHASEFMIFENAFSNNGNTTGSVASLLTGMSPLTTGVVFPPDALSPRDARRSLPHLLGQLGYQRSNWAVPHYADATEQNLIGAFESNNGRSDRLGQTRVPLGDGTSRWFVSEMVRTSVDLLADVFGIRELDNPYSQVSHIVGDSLSDEERLAGTIHELAEPGPRFVNTHFMGSHGPVFNVERSEFADREQERPWQGDHYDDAIREFDRKVEATYTALNEAGDLDDTIIVVTSDHGQQYDATKRVPLLIRLPERQGAGRYDVNVQRLDVAPTILEALGVSKPDWMEGESLLRPARIRTDREIRATTAPERKFAQQLGFRERRDGLIVTTIRCRAFVSRSPDGELRRGLVPGSTSSCRDRPKAAAGSNSAS